MNSPTITILTVGSRGDVQPFIALSQGLQNAGYRVNFATEPAFADWVQSNGVNFVPLRADFVRLAQTTEGKAAIAGKKNTLALIKQVKPMLRHMLEDAWRAAQTSTALIYHPKVLAGYHIAEKLNIPGFLAMMLPAFSATGAFANPALGAYDFGKWLNRLTYEPLMKVSMLPYQGLINHWRQDVLHLSPASGQDVYGKATPKIYAYSPHVLPSPPDWDDSAFVSGYWFLSNSQDWTPPDALLQFLEAGEPPVYVGFGSMPSEDAATKTQIVLAAAKQAGKRLILATGWGGLQATDLPETAYLLDAAPHEWLFPKCVAIAHHGGAGTTGASLRAGKPTIICPFFGDQPFWGQRVFELGVGPRPIPQKRLTVETLAAAIALATSDTTMRDRAYSLGQKIQAEDGVKAAVEFIGQRLRTI